MLIVAATKYINSEISASNQRKHLQKLQYANQIDGKVLVENWADGKTDESVSECQPGDLNDDRSAD